MPQVDAVRAYQLPTSAPSQLYLSQYNLAANAPVYITPGFGGTGSGQFPPINTWTSHYDFTETFYCAAASSEKEPEGEEAGGGDAGGPGGSRDPRHVKRVFQEDADGKINPDVYVDLLRIDKMPMNYGTTNSGKLAQRVKFKLKWNDDPNDPSSGGGGGQGENANGGRETKQLEVKAEGDSSEDAVQLWIVEKLKVAQSGVEDDATGREVQFIFHNDKETSVGAA